MNILIAEDDDPSRLLLQSLLSKWGYAVTTAADGDEAWAILCKDEHPQIVVLDWLMPGLEGPEIVRRLRERAPEKLYYAIIITARNQKGSVISALESGADDFIGKPFDHNEFRARIGVGVRMMKLQLSLLDNLKKLNTAMAQVKQLEGIIPICMYCKKIRDDQNSWNQLEQYISDHSQALFSHGICPECYELQIEELKLHKEP